MQNAPDHTLVAGPRPRRAGSRPKGAILAEPAQPRLSAALASLDARQPADAFDPRVDVFTAAARWFNRPYRRKPNSRPPVWNADATSAAIVINRLDRLGRGVQVPGSAPFCVYVGIDLARLHFAQAEGCAKISRWHTVI